MTQKDKEIIARAAGVAIDEVKDNLTVGGYLDLEGTAITSLPDNLTVGGFLDLRGTGITSLPDNLTVGGSLYLEGTGITSLPDNLTVGGSLHLEGTGITSLPDNLTVGGCLDLAGTGITSLPDNLTVGGSLYLEGTGITSLPDNLTVGGCLDLAGTGITSLPDNLTVGGSLYLACTAISDTSEVNRITPPIFYWRNKKYIKVDGLFSELVSQRGHVMRVKMIGKKDISYIVTDGKYFAHGSTLKEAKEDLVYKVTDRRKEDFESLNSESVLSHSEAIACYRTITGACSFGTRDFCENRLKKQRTYTVKEIAQLTAGEYGNNAFMAFFKIV